MEFKHSPAPWAVDDNGIFFEITREDGLRIGDVCSSQHLYDDSNHNKSGVAYANACLIAAAPELLALLIKLDRIGGLGLSTHKEIQSVIAKALGQQ
ncbi:hypothetical protein [Providencia huaxiensis]|uniref:hypothetical protein n=1 Tax=Providencia huaxiensis TaxID=2027290 RepID=UPI0034E54AE9